MKIFISQYTKRCSANYETYADIIASVKALKEDARDSRQNQCGLKDLIQFTELKFRRIAR